MRWQVIPASLFSAPVFAQAAAESLAPLDPVSAPYLVKLTGGLILVVAIIFLLAWLLKKFNLNPQSQNGLIRIVAGLNIGTRDRIVLLQVGEEQILLGLTPGRIEKLHSLAKPVEPHEYMAEPDSFVAKFNQLMGEGKKS